MADVDFDNEAGFQEQVVKNDLQSIIPPKEAILSELERHGYSECDIFGIKLAVEEALTNAVKHGNTNDPDKQFTVHFSGLTAKRPSLTILSKGGYIANVPLHMFRTSSGAQRPRHPANEGLHGQDMLS